MKLYKMVHCICDFNKCFTDIQKKIKYTEKYLEQLDSSLAKFLIEARKIKSFMGIYETSIEKSHYTFLENICIFMKIVLENCILMRIGTRSSYLGSYFFIKLRTKRGNNILIRA